jgi:tetratricopeptide (TPR) repeat protein
MNFFKRIGDWLGISPPKQKPDMMAIRDLIELGRQARYQENYANALDIFEKSVLIAQSRQDSTALVIAQLNIADTYVQMERYDEAKHLLQELEADTKHRQYHTPLAYVICLQGYIEQLHGNWEQARDLYNEALSIAEKANADGAKGRAKGHLADTYLREGNATYAEHLLREALPLLDQTNDVELTSHFIGQYALTMLQLGRETDGDRLLDSALQRAKRLNFITETRHWHQVLGQRKLDKHEYKSAFQHYHDFLQLSPDPMPQTETYGLALSNMSEIARQLGQHDEALTYALQAEEVLGALDSDTLSHHALTAIGLAMRANHQYDDAQAYFKRALNLAPEDEATSIQLEIAQTHVMSGHYSDAESVYVSLLETLDAEADGEQIADIHNGLGNVYQAQNKLDDAIQQWMQAFKLYENQSNHNQTARIICDMAQARYLLGDGKRALSDYERALMLLNSVDKQTRGIVMANVAIAYADKGDVATTESFFTEAIDIARELNDTTAEALRRNNYASYLIDIGQAQRAVVSLEHALKLIDEQPNPLYSAIFLDNMGLAYRTLHKPDKALENHTTAQTHLASEDSSDWTLLNQLHLVETYLDLEQVAEASNHLPQFDNRSIDVGIQHHLTLARLYLVKKQLTDAASAISQAISQAQSGYRQRLLAKSLVLQSRIQATMDDKETATTTWQAAEKLLTMLQMPKPTPNWLHVPSSTEEE